MNIKAVYCMIYDIQPQMLKFINYQKATLSLHTWYLLNEYLDQRSKKK